MGGTGLTGGKTDAEKEKLKSFSALNFVMAKG